MTPPTDLMLLRMWRGGDEAAGKELCERHYVTVFQFFGNKIRHKLHREELIQETFLGCIEAADSYRAEASFQTFLLGIALNKLRNYYRISHRRRALSSVSIATLEDPGLSPYEHIRAKEEERLLLEGLRNLTLEQQLILELKYWERLKIYEIAELLDLSNAAVKNRTRKARQRLEKAIKLLASSPQQLQSTLTRLDDWADGVRRSIARHSARGHEDPPRLGDSTSC